MVTGGGKAAVERPECRWVNTILGNIKSALRGTYHAIRPKYAQRYLAEFEYRFNGCNSETDVSRGALAGEGDDIVRDGDFSTIGVGE